MEKNDEYQIIFWDNLPLLNNDKLEYFQYILQNTSQERSWHNAIQKVEKEPVQVDHNGFSENSFVLTLLNNSELISIRFLGEDLRLETQDDAIAFVKNTIAEKKEEYNHALLVVDLCLDHDNNDYSIGMELCNQLEAVGLSVLRLSSVYFQESEKPIARRAAINNTDKMDDAYLATGPSIFYSDFLESQKEWTNIDKNIINMLSFLLRSQYVNKQYLGAALYSMFQRINNQIHGIDEMP